MHLNSFHSTYSCMPNVLDNNMCQAQMYALFYYLIVLTSSVQDDGAVAVLRRMNYLSQEGL